MSDEYKRDNNGNNDIYNTNEGDGEVNFQLVEPSSDKEEKAEEKRRDYDLWRANENTSQNNQNNQNSQNTSYSRDSQYSYGGQAQYKAPDYGYQSGQNASYTREGYRSEGYQNNTDYGNSYHNNGGYDTYGSFHTNDYSGDNHAGNGNAGKHGDGSRKGGFGKKLLKTAAIAAVFGLVAGTAFQGVNVLSSRVFASTEKTAASSDTNGTAIAVTQTTSDGTTTSTDVSALVDNAMPSMVAITSTIVENYNYFGHTLSQEAEGSGSGIIVGKNNNQLLIVTNNHVIDGAKTISVCFIDKEIVQAEVKGTDTSSDLAVVAVDMNDIKDETKAVIKVAVLGDSDELKLGQMAVAIGNALGYGQSVTVGYISALDRTVSVGSGSSATTMNLIQTDAAINPGNSGGALLNMKGEVVGINSAKLADTDVEGMGYAIPITSAIPIINDLMNREVLAESEKGYLGITGQDITDENNIYNMPTGVYVYEVAEEGAAKEAGMQQGDIIVKINGNDVTNMEAVQNKVNNTKVGTVITVTVMRNINGTYEEVDLEVTLKGYDSLNSLREETQNQSGQPSQQESDSENEVYDSEQEDSAEEFFEKFFGDFGY